MSDSIIVGDHPGGRNLLSVGTPLHRYKKDSMIFPKVASYRKGSTITLRQWRAQHRDQRNQRAEGFTYNNGCRPAQCRGCFAITMMSSCFSF